jgi:hypothetical protein
MICIPSPDVLLVNPNVLLSTSFVIKLLYLQVKEIVKFGLLFIKFLS